MSITKRNYLLSVTLLTVLLGGVGGGVYFACFPHHYFGGYPLIPVFFLLFGIFHINMIETCRMRMPKYLLQIHLLARVLRMFFSVIVMVVYSLAVGEEVRVFLMTFIVNYLIYLIYDSWFFLMFESNRKLKKKQNNEKIA